MAMKKVLIVYHSQTGNTEAMAKAVYEGAISAGANIAMKKATEATCDDLLGCDVVAFGTPNYFSTMAGTMKSFFDQAWTALRGKLDGKPYAAFGSAGGGGKAALDSVDKLCGSFGLKKACDCIVATGKPSADVLQQCRELGKRLAQL